MPSSVRGSEKSRTSARIESSFRSSAISSANRRFSVSGLGRGGGVLLLDAVAFGGSWIAEEEAVLAFFDFLIIFCVAASGLEAGDWGVALGHVRLLWPVW